MTHTLSKIQIVNDLEMFLTKQCFGRSLVSIKQQDHRFSTTEKQNSNRSKYTKDFSVRSNNVFSIRLDNFILAVEFCQHQL